ncbi:TetR/AcrR family transcriptional regulator [Amycolatopsis sp. NPDC051102]|uniref:TetR/AcrR family transcriptional regulator n=1 Tax=Amycolatopsis sp. NPDC051102 TaxID=3155163 RepID=UPI0034384021
MNSDKQAAERLQKLRLHLADKTKRIEALLQLFATNPTLPIEAMVREYGGVLDATDGRAYLQRVQRDAGADGLGYRQRAARTKRIRTRERLITAATQLVVERRTEGGNFLEAVARVSGVSVPTISNHFPSKNDLLWAVYDRLLQPILNSTTKGR